MSMNPPARSQPLRALARSTAAALTGAGRQRPCRSRPQQRWRLRRNFDDAVRSLALGPAPPAWRNARAAGGAQLRDLERRWPARAGPGQRARHWRLSLSDLGEMMFLPPLARVLRSESPLCQVSNVSVDATQVSAALEARDIDLAIGILLPEHRGIASESLFQEHFVAITGRDWRPAVGRAGKGLSTQQLARAALAVAAPMATFHGSVEAMLVRLKLSERAVVRVRHYGALPELVTSTDMLAIVPQMFAHSLAPRYAVRVWELPGHGPRYNVRMMWHQSATNDSAHVWLRERVRSLFARGT
jgi:DNA-binding transcriptional LysR family regulator